MGYGPIVSGLSDLRMSLIFFLTRRGPKGPWMLPLIQSGIGTIFNKDPKQQHNYSIVPIYYRKYHKVYVENAIKPHATAVTMVGRQI